MRTISLKSQMDVEDHFSLKSKLRAENLHYIKSLLSWIPALHRITDFEYRFKRNLK